MTGNLHVAIAALGAATSSTAPALGLDAHHQYGRQRSECRRGD